MSNFIKVKLSDRNEFRCLGAFELFGLKPSNLSFKIDTGCGLTSIPLKKANIEESVLKMYKDLDYADTSIEKQISFGVNDTIEYRNRARELLRQGRYSEIDSLTCTRPLDNFTIDGINLGTLNVRVSYTRVGNILIGMDILSKMDCHIAKTPTGETYFIACPLINIKNNKADKYYLELERLCGLGSKINSALVRRDIGY